jgi:hypothetical protein
MIQKKETIREIGQTTTMSRMIHISEKQGLPAILLSNFQKSGLVLVRKKFDRLVSSRLVWESLVKGSVATWNGKHDANVRERMHSDNRRSPLTAIRLLVEDNELPMNQSVRVLWSLGQEDGSVPFHILIVIGMYGR